jgi:hypothetical protein
LSEDWYLTGYCHLRQSVRTFRLSRIERLEILKVTFEYPEEGTIWLDEVSDQPPLFVQALFNQSIVPRVRKSTQYSILEESKSAEIYSIFHSRRGENTGGNKNYLYGSSATRRCQMVSWIWCRCSSP